MTQTVEQLISQLGLQPHPEGGFFAETYRAQNGVPLPAPHNGVRAFGTAIYFLITPDAFSSMHKVTSDEVFHFYLGDPVEQLHLYEDGSTAVVEIGSDFAAGARPQVVVPAGAWQGCRLKAGGAFALMGCTVSPGFDFADFELSDAEPLIAKWPDQEELIRALTHR